jgi:ketosteroid isomerase-like protein
MTARKKAARKPAAKTTSAARPARPAKAAAAKTAAKPRTGPSAEQVAQLLVKLTQANGPYDLEALYAADCISREASGEPTRGRAALEAKFRGFEAMVKSQRWKALQVFVKGDAICIEWHGQLELADGRRVTMDEVAIHELAGGKISSERFYYDPSVLAPPAAKGSGKSGTRKREPLGGPPPVLPEFDGGPPPIDPIDL